MFSPLTMLVQQQPKISLPVIFEYSLLEQKKAEVLSKTPQAITALVDSAMTGTDFTYGFYFHLFFRTLCTNCIHQMNRVNSRTGLAMTTPP